jgi:hypothetical protein
LGLRLQRINITWAIGRYSAFFLKALNDGDFLSDSGGNPVDLISLKHEKHLPYTVKGVVEGFEMEEPEPFYIGMKITSNEQALRIKAYHIPKSISVKCFRDKEGDLRSYDYLYFVGNERTYNKEWVVTHIPEGITPTLNPNALCQQALLSDLLKARLEIGKALASYQTLREEISSAFKKGYMSNNT